MKLRPLLLALAVLAPVAGLVWWWQTPPSTPASADARIGQRVADPARLAEATRVRITTAGNTVELARGENEPWALVATPDAPALPADAERLNRLASDLITPKIERLVSARPEKIATYDLDATSITFLDAAGAPLLALHLGKTTEGGGRILRYGDEPRAYLARLAAVIDASVASWRDTTLVTDLKSEDVASISIGFPDTSAPLLVSRFAADQPWTSLATPADHQIKASLLTTQLSNLGSLRYTGVAARIDPEAVAARIFPREVTLTTFAGRTIHLSIGRAPEPVIATSDDAANQTNPPPAPRKIFAEINDSGASSTLAAASRTHAFEIAEWVFSALPATSADLFEPTPAASSASATNEDASSPPRPEPVSVFTEPVGVDFPSIPGVASD